MKTTNVEKVMIGISYFLRLLILVEAVTAAWNKRPWLVFLSSIILILTFIPSFIKRNYKINLPIELELIVVIFISCSLFLGEMQGYYNKFWWWDVMLHSISSIVMAFVGFIILFILYTEKKVKAKPGTIALFTFCFALAMGALWEIAEFSMDVMLGWNMQKSGLFDTMWDLIVDALAALTISIAGYFYIREKKYALFFTHMIERFAAQNPRLFRRRR
jgi:hypothetical protein